jgi:DUF1680 family protein
VTVTGGRLLGWIERNRTATIPHAIAMLEEVGNLDNMRRLIGESDAPHRGLVFADSDIYKVLEGIAWELGRSPDPALRGFFDSTIALLARAQRTDGYLNSYFQREDRPSEPWSDFVHGHELYCLGHLIQAAVAAKRSLGEDALLDIALRFVDRVIELFGAEDRPETCGHPEIETALVELYRLGGDRRHLALALALVERRGKGFIGDGIFGSQYYQDDTTVRETEIMRGHAVRALYLNAGVTDLYLETGDEGLLQSMRRQWDDLVTRRLYITGGTGSRHRDEAFGDGYELPSERAYAETCAGIALMHWAWRMHLATGEATYLDVYEQCLYNVVAAGISEDGCHFFYSNPLQRRPDHGISQEESAGHRLPWFACACCPPNLVRLFATLENYLVSTSPGRVMIGNYATATVTAEGVTLDIETDFPDTGEVTVTVHATGTVPSIALRVPGWATEAHVTVGGIERVVEPEDGWMVLEDLSDGDVVVFSIPPTVRVLAPHPRADGLRGSVAVARGPVVYCLDQVDNTVDIDSIDVVPESISAHVDAAGDVRLRAAVVIDPRDPASIPLYSPLGGAHTGSVTAEVTLRSYSSWGNGASAGSMRVWIPQARTGSDGR